MIHDLLNGVEDGNAVNVAPLAPRSDAADAMLEAADAGIKFIVAITEGVPVLDMTRVYPFVKEKGARLLGRNCPGLITPGESKVGIIPGRMTPRQFGPMIRAPRRFASSTICATS